MYNITNANLPNIKFTAGVESEGFKITLGAESAESLMKQVETICEIMGAPNPLKGYEKESTPDAAVGVLVNKLLVYVEANNHDGIETTSKALQRLLSVRN
jgi:hypothetical protein